MHESEAYKRVHKTIAIEGEIRCKVCGQAIAGRCVVCAACETPHHQDCWSYSGGCSVYGCRKAESVAVPLPEKEIEALRAEVARRRREARAWKIAAAAVLALAGALAYRWPARPVDKPVEKPLRTPAPPVSPEAPPAPPSAKPASRPPVIAPPQRITPPTREAIPLEMVFAAGQPTSAPDAARAAFAQGPGELKVVSMSLAPAGAYIVTIPAIGNTAALGGARVRVHLTAAAPALDDPELVARTVLEEWTYRGRSTPLPAIATKVLEKAGLLSWDVTGLVGEKPVRIAILPAVADFEVLRRMRTLEGRAVAWMSVGDPEPAAPAVVRALPDLAITGMKLEGQQVLVYFENRGKTGWAHDGFNISLGLTDGRGVLGSADPSLTVPAPGVEAVAHFPLHSLRGILGAPGKTMLKAEIDWADAVPESDESNNIAKRELELPASRFGP